MINFIIMDGNYMASTAKMEEEEGEEEEEDRLQTADARAYRI